MKKRFLYVVLILGITTMISCKSDYDCACQKVRTTDSTTVKTEDGVYTYTDNRARAEKRCDLQETSSEDIHGEYTRECQIQ